LFEKHKKGVALPLPIRIALLLVWGFIYLFMSIVRRQGSKPIAAKKVLVIQLKSLGDVIFITPALKALRMNFPAALIHVLIKPKNKEILENNPYVDVILTTDVEYGGEVPLSNLIGLIRSLRKQRFDLVLDFTGDLFFSSWLAYLTGAKYRVDSRFLRRIMGIFRLKGSGGLMSHEAQAESIVYAPQYFLDQLRLLGMVVKDENLSLCIDEKETNFILKFLSEEKVKPKDCLVVIHPGAGWVSKRWGVGNYAQLADELIKNNRLAIVFTGTEQERDLISSILARMQYRSAAIVAPSLSLRQFAALIARCQLLICGDTAALHMAVALGTRTISVFGPTGAEQFSPCNEKHITLQSEKECSPCRFFNQRGFIPKCPFSSYVECMREISFEVLKEAVMRQLSSLGISKYEENNYGF
jgi:ADP-heptose:LPS heptosyltransferase